MFKSMINPDLSGKKIVIIVLLSIALTSLLLAEDIKLQEITLDELLSDYLADYKLEKRIQLEGIGRDFAVAKETGEIVAVTEIGNLFKVYFLDKIGNLQWEKEFSGKGYETNCTISDNGKAIVITNYISEDALNTVLDNSGNILFERKLKDIKLKPIPNGQFFYEEIGMMANREKGVYIYDRSGDEIGLTGFDFSNEEDIRLEFLNNQQIISYMDTKFVFFEFSDGFLKEKWSYEFMYKYNYEDFFHSKINYIDNLIYISIPTAKIRSFLFDYNGNLIFSDNDYYNSSSFTDDLLILSSITKENQLIRVFDRSMKNFVDYANPFIIGKYYFHKYTDVFELENYLFFNRFKDSKQSDIGSFIFENNFSFIGIVKFNIQKIDNRLIIIRNKPISSEILFIGGYYEN